MMKLMSKRDFVAFANASTIIQATRSANANPTTSEQTFTSDAERSFVNSIVLLGERTDVLIDAQLDQQNAAALADRIAGFIPFSNEENERARIWNYCRDLECI
jgi:hypothetical protein